MGAIRFDQDEIETLLSFEQVDLAQIRPCNLAGALVEMAEQGNQGRAIRQSLTAGKLTNGIRLDNQFPIV